MAERTGLADYALEAIFHIGYSYYLVKTLGKISVASSHSSNHPCQRIYRRLVTLITHC